MKVMSRARGYDNVTDYIRDLLRLDRVDAGG